MPGGEECAAEAGEAAASSVCVLRAGDVADPEVAEGEQVFGGEDRAGLVVDGHARDAAGLSPVDEQRGKPPPKSPRRGVSLVAMPTRSPSIRP